MTIFVVVESHRKLHFSKYCPIWKFRLSDMMHISSTSWILHRSVRKKHLK